MTVYGQDPLLMFTSRSIRSRFCSWLLTVIGILYNRENIHNREQVLTLTCNGTLRGTFKIIGLKYCIVYIINSRFAHWVLTTYRVLGFHPIITDSLIYSYKNWCHTLDDLQWLHLSPVQTLGLMKQSLLLVHVSGIW